MARFAPFDTAASLVDCLCAALKSETRDDDDRWDGDCCIFPGSEPPASLQCCEGKGLLSVNIQNGTPSTRFPVPDGTADGCGPSVKGMATTYVIKATRCVGLPSIECGCDCREKNAFRLLGDLEAMLSGISCCFKPSEDEFECTQYVINSWSLLPAGGGCSGVLINITVESDGVCCPVVVEGE